MSTFAAYPEGRRGSPGLPFSFLLLHKRGTLVLYLRGTHYGTHLSFLFGMCGTLLGARQIDPPWNWVPHAAWVAPVAHMFHLFFLPCDAACKNISCRITDQCRDPRFQRGYSSKKKIHFYYSFSLSEGKPFPFYHTACLPGLLHPISIS